MHNVRTAFDRGAGRYDLLTSLNPGYHRHLRFAAGELRRRIGGADADPHRLLDLACGSGSSTRALLSQGSAEVLGVDASEGMLAEALRKPWPDGVRFSHEVCGRLNLRAMEPGTWDGAFAAYLFRNVPSDARDEAIREVFALLRPGGWLVAQEYSVGDDADAARRWDRVSRSIIIPLAVMLDGNADLYHYLWRSVHEFDAPATFMDRLHDAGFVDIATTTAPGWQRGILHTFVARKP